MQELQILDLSDRDYEISMFKWLVTQIFVTEVSYTQIYEEIHLLKLKILENWILDMKKKWTGSEMWESYLEYNRRRIKIYKNGKARKLDK